MTYVHKPCPKGGSPPLANIYILVMYKRKHIGWFCRKCGAIWLKDEYQEGLPKKEKLAPLANRASGTDTKDPVSSNLGVRNE